VNPQQFSQARLVVLGHGTTLNEDSATPVLQQCGELRRRKIFLEVREAFWKQAPSVQDVLSRTSGPEVLIVPFFISEGHFSENVIPQALGFGQEGQKDYPRVIQRGGQRLVYCRPVGSHDSMTGVLVNRAREIVEKFPFPRVPPWKETTLFIAGHGTAQNEDSRKVIEHQAELIRSHKLYADVRAVFLEEEPFVKDCCRRAQTRNVIVVPFFVSDGLHAREEIPVLMGEPAAAVRQRLEKGQPTWRNPTEKSGKLVWYAPSVGTDPKMAEVILERAREGAHWLAEFHIESTVAKPET
jgi:sirohydrochlorin cobaltochelatase